MSLGNGRSGKWGVRCILVPQARRPPAPPRRLPRRAAARAGLVPGPGRGGTGLVHHGWTPARGVVGADSRSVPRARQVAIRHPVPCPPRRREGPARRPDPRGRAAPAGRVVGRKVLTRAAAPAAFAPARHRAPGRRGARLAVLAMLPAAAHRAGPGGRGAPLPAAARVGTPGGVGSGERSLSSSRQGKAPWQRAPVRARMSRLPARSPADGRRTAAVPARSGPRDKQKRRPE